MAMGFSLQGALLIVLVFGGLLVSANKFVSSFQNYLHSENKLYEPFPLGEFSREDQDMIGLQTGFITRYAPMNTFASRLEKLHEVKANRRILPPPMAKELIETYNRQIKSLHKVEARLDEIEKLRIPLADGLEKLSRFNESSENAVSALQELESNRAKLLALHSQIEQSSQNLEAILTSAENEAQKRVLRAELEHLAQTASQSAAAHPPELALGASSYDLEQQITSEITHYMQMEQEVERQLA